jgi:hypothetical protein
LKGQRFAQDGEILNFERRNEPAGLFISAVHSKSTGATSNLLHLGHG